MVIWILAIVLGVLAIVIISAGVKVVPQSETRVVERLGRFHKVLPPGMNFIIPFIDRCKIIYTRTAENGYNGSVIFRSKSTPVIDLREQVYDFPSQQVITRDNVITNINALLYFQIADPKKAVYEIDNLPNAIEKLTQTSLRNVIGSLDLEQTLTSRDTINTKLQGILDEATNKWGVKVNRVELQDIQPPESVRVAMEKLIQADRNKRAEILTAEGERRSLILRSEGQKESEINIAEAKRQSQILSAQGEAEAILLNAKAQAEAVVLNAQAEAEAIRKITDAVVTGQTDPATYLLALKYIETLGEMTSGQDNKTVYIPYEASSVLSSIGSIRSLFENK